MSLFITFEGPDGSGKSTQIKLLSETLTAAGYDVLTVREPGGTPISEQIRDVVHSLHNREMSDRAECLLYNAARAQLVDQLIVPHLRQRGGGTEARDDEQHVGGQQQALRPGPACAPGRRGGHGSRRYQRRRRRPARERRCRSHPYIG